MIETKSISLSGSEKLSWEDIDEYANKHGFSTTSGFTQHVFEKEILGVKTKIKEILTYVMFLLILVMMALTLLLILR